MSKVGIVLVNYNGAKFQNECVRTLFQMSNHDFEVILVDNASEDNSVQQLKEEFSNIHYLLQDENLGVAEGNNIGIQYSIKLGTEYTLLLNNDTELDEELLKELLKYANENTVAVPKIYYYHDKQLLWYAGGELDWKHAEGTHRGFKEIDQGQYDTTEKITYSPTCCMLIHNCIFDKVGVIDKRYFMYYDDTDFCARLADRDVNMLYVPSAVIWHKVSSSSGGANTKLSIYYYYRNRLYYIRKNRNKVMRNVYAMVFKDLVRGFMFPIRKNKNERYIIVGYFDFYIGHMGKKKF